MMDGAFILSDISRCAEASVGVPPGKSRFEAETGIPESFWTSRC
jgi:DNA integrity scanning protein DisA with diadenylate cyclase activity